MTVTNELEIVSTAQT